MLAPETSLGIVCCSKPQTGTSTKQTELKRKTRENAEASEPATKRTFPLSKLVQFADKHWQATEDKEKREELRELGKKAGEGNISGAELQAEVFYMLGDEASTAFRKQL